METIIEIKLCNQCGTSFDTTDKDIAFYDKISPTFAGKKYAIPSPSLCPDCRQQRRLMFRNTRKLYRRKCDATGKDIIAIHDASSPYKVYDDAIRRSDQWDPLEYGRMFDEKTPFFEQFYQLSIDVPDSAIWSTNCVNCDYCHISMSSKNCYLLSGAVNSEDCLFGNIVWKCNNCIDGTYLYSCEQTYESIDCYNCFNLKYGQNCQSCSDSRFLLNCSNCQKCFGCVGENNQQYSIFNKKYTKEDYEEEIKKYLPLTSETTEIIRNKIKIIKQKIPFKYFEGLNNEESSGNYMYNCRDVAHSFDLKNSEDCKYIYTCDNGNNSYDLSYMGVAGGQRSYNIISSPEMYGSMCCFHCSNATNIAYCIKCVGCQDCFGCVGLRDKSYCILNKQYTKAEYETEVGKIIDSLIAQGTWGEFFPVFVSPFAYNETEVMEYFPLTKEEAIAQGYQWKDEEEKIFSGPVYVPLSIDQYDEKIIGKEIAEKNKDEISQGILKCKISGKPFRIIAQELDFYIKNHLPIPTKHPDARHMERMNKRNPRKLRDRKCMKCGVEIETSYAPERKELVYCEQCYNREVYG